MTNGSVEITKGALQKGRLDPYQHVNKMMDVVQAGIWKPRAECYHYAAQQLQLTPSEVSSPMRSMEIFLRSARKDSSSA